MSKQHTSEIWPSKMFDEVRKLERMNNAPEGTPNCQNHIDAQAAMIENELLRREHAKRGNGIGSACPLITVKELRELGALLPEELPDDAVALGSAKAEMAVWASYPAQDLDDAVGTITVSRGRSVRTLTVAGSTTFALHGFHFVETFEYRTTMDPNDAK